jgi:hypothetical protein
MYRPAHNRYFICSEKIFACIMNSRIMSSHSLHHNNSKYFSFIYGIFEDAVNNSDYIASNGTSMIIINRKEIPRKIS